MTTGYVTRFKGKVVAAALQVTGTLIAKGGIQRTVSPGLTATGTNVGTALALTSSRNQFSTVASGTGAVLPVAVAGLDVTVFNDGANPLLVYGNGTDTVDGGASATLTNAKRCTYYCLTVGAWESAQLGVTSA